MELKNRMQTKPDATIEMDIFRLNQRAQPKENAMRNEVVLRLKDDSPAPNMPTANWPAIRRRLAEAAREVDATCASLGVQSSIEQQVLDAVNQALNPSKAANPFMDAWLKSQARFQAEQRAQRLAREFQAAQAVPLAKRIKPDYAKVY